MSVIFTLETTGISQGDAEEILREFHQTIVSHAQSLGTGSTIVIKGLRFQRTGELQMSPINLLRSSSFFSQDSYCGESIMTNLDVQIIAETLREILVYHHALGGGWIKIVGQEPFKKGAGWLLYESSPSVL